MTATEPDVGRLIGLTGPGAWVLAGLFAVTYTTLAIMSGGAALATVPGAAALVLVVAAAVALVVPGPYPLPLPLTLAVLAVVAFATVAICWQLWPYGWPGWASWNFGACTFLMFMVALRGRVVWATAGLVLMALLTMHWTWASTGDAWHGLDLTYRQLVTFGAGAFFASWLRRTARRIVAFQEAEQRRVAADVTRRAADGERARQLDRVRRLAGAALAEIAAGSVSTDRRHEHALVEATLRDGIRGRALAEHPLAEEVLAARRRGVAVSLLDDLRADSLAGDELAAARAWAADRLADVPSGEVTIRLAGSPSRPTLTFTAGEAAPVVYGAG